MRRDQAQLRLARGREVPGPRRRARALRRAAWASAARGCARSGGALAAYAQRAPELADELDRMQRRELPDGWDAELPSFPADAKGMASREARGKVLNASRRSVPWLIGGSADLDPLDQDAPRLRRRRRFRARRPRPGATCTSAIREHAMGGDLNGLALSQAARRSARGFLIFSDYARPAIRLSALMEIPVIHIFTHDSIGVGEDGPTHQPVEQLASLRAIPGLDRHAARRRQRGRRGVAGDHGAAARAGGAGADAPGRARRSTARSTRRPTGCARAPTCSPTRRRRRRR